MMALDVVPTLSSLAAINLRTSSGFNRAITTGRPAKASVSKIGTQHRSEHDGVGCGADLIESCSDKFAHIIWLQSGNHDRTPSKGICLENRHAAPKRA